MNSNDLDQAGPAQSNPAQSNPDHDMRLQAEAEHAEREGHPSGRDPDVDRYRFIVRALRQPLEPQLADDFAVHVAKIAMQRGSHRFEDVLESLLLLVMGIVALLFVGPALAKAAQTIVSIPLPSLPWHQLVVAAICIGLVWAVDAGWMRLHPDPRRR